MKIVIDLNRSTDGTPTGTAKPRGSGPTQNFSGIIELLACLERMYATDSGQSGLRPTADSYRHAGPRVRRLKSRPSVGAHRR
jgi:hypothetical protein